MRDVEREPEIRVRTPEGRILADYVTDAPALRPFFNGNPDSLAAFRRKAAEVDRRFDRAGREAMAEAIRPTSAGAERALRRVVEEDGLLVTTGQQAGAFSGPLYTIYKVLSAVRHARALEDALQRPVAPLFWVASEDHDWAEVDHAYVLDANQELRHIPLDAGASGPPRSMARRRLTAGLDDALGALTEVLPATAFTPLLIKQIRAAYRVGSSVAGAFTELLASWLAPFDVLITDAASPPLKRLSIDVLAAEARGAEASERAVAGQTRALEATGQRAQVAVLEGEANLFYECETGRERLIRRGEFHEAVVAGRRWTSEELAAEIAAEPASFSPNVLLRPVVETRVFPTVAYVAGPAELAYHAQLGCLFRLHGASMPIVVPRASVQIVEPKVRRALERVRLEPDELVAPIHELAMRLAREALPDDVVARLASLRGTIEAGFAALAATAEPIDPTLEGPLGRAGRAAEQEVDRAELKILRRLKARNDVAMRSLRQSKMQLFPLDSPQERVLSAPTYLARYGPRFLERVLAALPEPRLDAEDRGAERCGADA
ncbi:MAG: bacillithiol biosynthesis cysteine-adding enzyme BshC [Longimicrobiales bacterium]